MKPFLKWAGGKSRLLEDILKNIPNSYDVYYELFLGSGALYFELCPTKAVLSDLNDELITTFNQVKYNPNELITKMKTYKNTELNYYEIRKYNPIKELNIAARFIYLNKLCYNGMYRVNKKGKFNVPYCHDESRKFLDKETIFNCSEVLKNADIQNEDFFYFYKKIKKKDFVYMDPPYAVQKKNNGFLEYNKKIFSWEDQKRLAYFAKELDKKGVYVLVSNVNADEVIELYEGFQVVEAYRNCGIGGKNAKRKKVKEILLKNY